MTRGRRRPNANERLPAMSRIELLLSKLVDYERAYLAIRNRSGNVSYDG